MARWQGPQHASPAGGAVSSAPLFPFRQGSFHGLDRAPSKGSSTSKKPLKPKLEPRLRSGVAVEKWASTAFGPIGLMGLRKPPKTAGGAFSMIRAYAVGQEVLLAKEMY